MPVKIPKVALPVEIPKVPLFKKKETEEEKEKRKEWRKDPFPCYWDPDDLEPDSESDEEVESDQEYEHERDRESEHERDRESEYERDRAYSEFISRREDDEDGGEGGVKEEDKEKEKEKEKRKEQAIPEVNLFTRMYFERVLFYFGELTHEAANNLLALIIYGNIQDNKKKILLLINSAGGDLDAGITLYDTMQHAHSGVDTLCAGSAFATAALVLSGGKERAATAYARIMIRKPRPPILKKKRKWEDPLVEIQRVRELTLILIQQLAKRTGKSEQTVKNDLKWPKFMSAEEAQIYGIIDSIVDQKTDKDPLL